MVFLQKDAHQVVVRRIVNYCLGFCRGMLCIDKGPGLFFGKSGTGQRAFQREGAFQQVIIPVIDFFRFKAVLLKHLPNGSDGIHCFLGIVKLVAFAERRKLFRGAAKVAQGGGDHAVAVEGVGQRIALPSELDFGVQQNRGNHEHHGQRHGENGVGE